MTMTVGELAKRAGVNLETVRFYEKQRLMPKPERTSGGRWATRKAPEVGL